MDKQQIHSARQAHLSSNLSISYRKPLYIARGEGQYLIDERGTRYLACVDNVCHVGHCHPKVVKAAQLQLATLNTNTRYLHPNIVKLAKRLTSTLPAPLQYCFFVNSGSEANDLALRLAREHTKNATEVLVLDHAYHGNLSSLIEISPYKFQGRGGFEKKSHVHIAPCPDTYRGKYKASDPRAGELYARDAVRILKRDVVSKGRRLAAFFAESALGCAGQVFLPRNYLRDVYTEVRKLGGVCVADEVQTGFGRTGAHFWAFEEQGVVPDIVTMGKPFGNGFPLAAVVTTKEIMESFASGGMEYFNTFGGSPVACAVGLAVLDAIEHEKLQENALNVGTHLLKRLKALQKGRHSWCIGDVRGRGLFIGIELVECHKTLAPAAKLAAEVVDILCEEHHILLSTDGPLHNVIKFKPPIVFTKKNANHLCDCLDKVLLSLQYKTKISKL